MAVGPKATLSRGYAIVRTENGRIVRSVGQVKAGEEVDVQVADGRFPATVRSQP